MAEKLFERRYLGKWHGIGEPRFENETDRQNHREDIARRSHRRDFIARFGSGVVYSTLTFDDSWLPMSDAAVKCIRKNLERSLMRAYPSGELSVYMTRQGSTVRPHLHTVSRGIPMDAIVDSWKYSAKSSNHFVWITDQDKIAALADYLFEH